ncbi:MAG TPA: hypothetical protein VMM76_27995 [Pirellulaceae bacterium]|nr:hypothetical protein [Pirellulaceae bacterium]
MISNTDILILGDEPALRAELQTAASALGEHQPRLRFAADHHALLEAVRSRPPGLVLVPFGDVPAEVAKLAREMATSSPPIPVAAIFRPNGCRRVGSDCRARAGDQFAPHATGSDHRRRSSRRRNT